MGNTPPNPFYRVDFSHHYPFHNKSPYSLINHTSSFHSLNRSDRRQCRCVAKSTEGEQSCGTEQPVTGVTQQLVYFITHCFIWYFIFMGGDSPQLHQLPYIPCISISYMEYVQKIYRAVLIYGTENGSVYFF